MKTNIIKVSIPIEDIVEIFKRDYPDATESDIYVVSKEFKENEVELTLVFGNTENINFGAENIDIKYGIRL